MKNLYKYLFYRLYSWNLKTWGESDMPHWNALYGVTFIMFLNIYFIALIIDKFVFDILDENISKSKIIAATSFVLLINYFIFLHKKKYKIIVQEYNGESQKTRKIKAILLWLFFLLSILVLYTMMII